MHALTPRRRAYLADCYRIVESDQVGEIDNDGKIRVWRGPYAGLDNDARAAGAVILERQHERVEFRA